MVTLLLRLLRLLPLLCGAHRHVALENLALRHQLAVYKKTVTRPKMRRSDRLFWVALSRVWAGWRQALVIVSPNTVLRWQRRRFCEHWTGLSGRPRLGRPPISAETAALIKRMAVTNPLRGAPRIHGELLKLGIDLAERTVSRLLAKRRPPPSQTWANVPHQPCSRPRLDRLLHRSHRSLARPLRPRRAGPRAPPRPPLQRDRTSHERLDGPAGRRRLPRRLRAVLPPPRSRQRLWSRVPATAEAHGDS